MDQDEETKVKRGAGIKVMSRDIDWRAFLNRLVFCWSCGKFGMPRKKQALPTGWKLIYQPHPEGRPGLHVCSDDCHEALRLAMIQGPVTEPLMLPDPASIMFPAEVKQAMDNEVQEGLVEEKFDQENWDEAKKKECEHVSDVDEM